MQRLGIRTPTWALAEHREWLVAIRDQRPDSGHFQQARHPLEVVDRRFDQQAKLGACQANAPVHLAAHLREAGKHMLDAC